MNLIIAVTEDLFSFAVSLFVGQRKTTSVTRSEDLLSGLRHDLEEREDTIIELPVRTDFNTVSRAYYQGVTPQKNTVMYIATTETPIRSEPTILRDTIIGSVTYGTMVMVLEVKNGWSRVLKGALEGWVETRDLADRAAHILPQFVIGEKNNPDDPNTIRLLAIIEDEFSAGAAGLPLQSHEYVLYKLKRKDQHIAWPLVRPRKPGTWHTILERVSGVTISPVPHAGSLMEFVTKDNIGHLAYVETVFPDESLQISEVNWPDDGIYTERVLVKEEWHELAPQFISIS